MLFIIISGLLQTNRTFRKQFFCFFLSISKNESLLNNHFEFEAFIHSPPHLTLSDLFEMNEIYLTSILDCTEQCCKLLLCSFWFVFLIELKQNLHLFFPIFSNTLPREIVTINGQESIVCL
jgi:hypothetical protein